MSWLESLWYKVSPWHILLFPLTVIFALLSFIRRFLYRHHKIQSITVPVPVIVVGNITVGGSGKTPVVIWLTEGLKAHGYKPGIISRGYKGTIDTVAEVKATSLAEDIGDEPLLLKWRTNVPVFVSPDRPLAANALLDTYRDTNVIISDDGMQHYPLHRDIEIAVIDGQRGFGNGLLLPSGPLREPVSRLKHVDFTIINGQAAAKHMPAGAIPMTLTGDTLYQLNNHEIKKSIKDFSKQKVHAIAGIGNPKRFFDHLQYHGLIVEEHSFPDHHAFKAADLALPGHEPILMTEKDAVKCQGFSNDRCWVMPIDARLPTDFEQHILMLLGRIHGSKTT